MRRRKSPDCAPWMIRWSYVEVSVRILLIALRDNVSGDAPCHSAGYSMAPTPTIVPWPCISLRDRVDGADGAGVGQADRGAGEVVDAELAAARLADEVLVRRPEQREVHRLGALDRGHQQLPAAVGLGQVDGEAEVDVRGVDDRRLAVGLGVGGVHRRHVVQRADHGPADQVGEGDLAAAAARQVVVDDDPVVDEQLGRHGADAGRGGDGERGLHVGDDAGGGAAQHGRLGGRRGSGGRCGREPPARGRAPGRASGRAWGPRRAAAGAAGARRARTGSRHRRARAPRGRAGCSR